MRLDELPNKIAKADSEGINNAIESIVTDETSAKKLATLLKGNPLGVIKRSLNLTLTQRQTLTKMSNQEISQLVAPIVKVLEAGDQTKLHIIRLIEGKPSNQKTIHPDPVGIKIKCTIEIDTDK